MEAAGGGQCVCRRGAGRRETCEEMPQMVPVSGLSPAPCDYAHFAADSFDLSLLECGAGDGEVPYSPTSIHQLLSLFAEQPCSPPLMFHPPARVKDEPLEPLEPLEPARDHRLLREVLRDTSFQRRHNVRAVDLDALARRAQDLVQEEAFQRRQSLDPVEDRSYLNTAFQDPVKGEVEDRQYLSPEAFHRRQSLDPVKGEVEDRQYLSPEAFHRRQSLDPAEGEVEDRQYLSPEAFHGRQSLDPVKGEVEDRQYLSPEAFRDPVKGEVEDRQYLEAFQRRQQSLDPAEEDAEAGPVSPGAARQDCLQHMEPVLALALQQLQRDVDDTCSVLGIASDPGQWTVDDVKAWLLWTLRQYNLPMVPMDYFAVDGVTLSALSEEEFQQRSPQCGSTLYAHLEIWKAARQELESRLDAGPWSNATAAPNSCSSGDMSDDEEEDCAHSPPAATSGSSTGAAPGKMTRGASHIHLWQFLKELLASPQTHGSCIRWLERGKGVFKIEDSVRVARLWGKRKNRPAMNYDKLSRSIRQYYKKGIMKKTERSQRLVYQFCHPYCL